MGTKENLLALLEEQRGSYISGEQIAGSLGISRAAIWKAIKSLRSEGYEIEAVTNRGYRLSEQSDVLSCDAIKSMLSDLCKDLTIEVFESTESTNLLCQNKASEGFGEGYVAIASAQSAGRGRRGRSFYSPPGTGLYLSILLEPRNYPGSAALDLTTMAAVAVCEAIEAVSDKNCDIKWVNDVYIDGKKVCGILSEASFSVEDGGISSVVVGIGINLYRPKGGFPKEIENIACSIFDKKEGGKRSALAAEVINRFMAYYRNPKGPSHFDEYKRRSMLIDKDVDVILAGATKKAHVLGLSDNCGLMVRYDDGSEETLSFGEVSVHTG